MCTLWVHAFDHVCKSDTVLRSRRFAYIHLRHMNVDVMEYIPYDSDVIRKMLSSLKYGARQRREPFDLTHLGEKRFLPVSATCSGLDYMFKSGRFVLVGNVMDLVAGDA
ncbi:hypothetical protein OBBRIDRAFT_330182 [Obba rivulosa]|uniref:Uncharacterized protein n=1 Tax=Obba rivulosa TaxID=1052685 RepID=A0A8E2AKV9_9APHY|nr:hypothetical protein OBBRIDRAFT_330182 [Obba rivulosa]